MKMTILTLGLLVGLAASGREAAAGNWSVHVGVGGFGVAVAAPVCAPVPCPPPVYFAPAPVYVPGPPVIITPPPRRVVVAAPRRVVYAHPPVVYGPPPGYYAPYHRPHFRPRPRVAVSAGFGCGPVW